MSATGPAVQSGSITARVAEFVVGTTAADIGDDVLARGVPSVIDTVGVIVAGARDIVGTTILTYAGEFVADGSVPPDWPTALAVLPAETAALVSSTLAHAKDFDDVLPGAGHPSAVVLSAVLAAARYQPLDGTKLLESYVIGVEVMARISRAVGHLHYIRGWHTTSTVGSLAAAAAAAKVMGLDAPGIRTALGLAASMASGLQRNFGTMTKPLHSGLAAHNGVRAARLASLGFTASLDVIDGPKGFLNVYSDGGSRPDRIDELGRPFAVHDPGLSMKKYACCFEVYRPIQAALDIRRRSGGAIERLRRVVCTVPPGTTGPLIDGPPRTGMEAKFSMEYAVAVALRDDEISLATFEDDASTRESIRSVMELIDVHEDVRTRPEDPSGANSSASSGGFVELVVETLDGHRHEAVVHHAIGTPQNPLTEADLKVKFLDCARAGGVDDKSANQVLARLAALRELRDVHAVLAELGG